MPEVEKLSRSITLDIRSAVEPCCDFSQFRFGVICMTAQFNDHIEFVFHTSTATVTPASFDGFQNEGIKEVVKSFLPVSRNDQLNAPLGELTTMFFLLEPFLHCLRSNVQADRCAGPFSASPCPARGYLLRSQLASFIQLRGHCYLIDIATLLLGHFNLVLENSDIPNSFRVGLNAAP